MQPSTPEQKQVALLLLKADLDIEAAAVQGNLNLHENIGFHCQQAVEKYAKALLVASALPAPFIHDLTKLLPPLQQANVIALSVQEMTDVAALNEFAVEFCYETDDAPSFTSADLLAMAERFRTKLRPLAQAFLI